MFTLILSFITVTYTGGTGNTVCMLFRFEMGIKRTLGGCRVVTMFARSNHHGAFYMFVYRHCLYYLFRV